MKKLMQTILISLWVLQANLVFADISPVSQLRLGTRQWASLSY